MFLDGNISWPPTMGLFAARMADAATSVMKHICAIFFMSFSLASILICPAACTTRPVRDWMRDFPDFLNAARFVLAAPASRRLSASFHELKNRRQDAGGT